MRSGGLISSTARLGLCLAVLIHWLPLPGVLGGATLRQLYGLGSLDPGMELLLQHRALMFALLSAPLLLALWRRSACGGAVVLLLSSDIGFLALAALHWPLDAALQRVLLFDLASITLLLLGGAGLGRRQL
ncbi:hypothetical protein [Aquimonas sp.]|uniref:hypothetical protein n=1 Tax=Aquimonas sp. TaxID=1872588 RepID=UPI0037BECF14